MRPTKPIISSIFVTLLLTFTIVPAFADVTWNSWTNGTSSTAPNAQNIEYVRAGTDSVSNQYVFQMNLIDLPSYSTPSDNLTLYGIYLGAPTLSVPTVGSTYPAGFSSSAEMFYMVWGPTGAYYNLPRGSAIPATFSISDANSTLEWRINTSSITSGNWFYGATSRLSDGYVIDTTAAAAVTPIPAAAWLLGSGIIGLIAIKRRNQRHSCDETHSLA